MPVENLRKMLFERDEKADDISDKPLWHVGVSLAASWAWGISIAIGIAIMHSKGILPYLVFLIPNVLAIPVFGVLRTKMPAMSKWPRWKPFLLFLLFVSSFALILNLKFINLALGGGTDLDTFVFLSQGMRVPVIMALGLLIVFFINKKGFRGSVLTDVGQYAFMVLGSASILVAGLIMGTSAPVQWITIEGNSLWWLKLSGLATLVAIMTHGAAWQRMESLEDSERIRGSMYGGLFFGLYMALVSAAAFVFVGNFVISLLFLVTLLAVATSTIDSATAAIQWIFQELDLSPYFGTALAALAIISWPLVLESSVTNFWKFYANIRLQLMVGLLAVTAIYSLSRSERVHSWVKEHGLVMEESPVAE